MSQRLSDGMSDPSDKPKGKRRGQWGRWLALLPAAAVCWFVARPCEYGVLNVFFRNHYFKDERSLNEDVAVDLTRKTLTAEGFDVTSLEPRPFGYDHPLLFARNSLNPNNGYVLWGDRRHAFPHWDYSVRIEKNGSDVLCRVSRPK
jgi:hypothetical protein